jgi:hypothetical protein
MAELPEIAEVRIGPISDDAGLRLAVQDLVQKVNELVQRINQLSATST